VSEARIAANSPTDAVLEAAQRGDPKAMERWLARHQSDLHRFAMLLCRDEDAARDVLQESLIAAARSLASFRGEAAPTTWLFAIARSFRAKQRRRRVGEPVSYVPLDDEHLATEALADAAPTPDVAAEAGELDRAVSAAIDELDDAQRRVVILSDLRGLTASEVGAALGISVEAVKGRLHRARITLRGRLAPLIEPERTLASAGRL
jgi:RNA polymerase sigma-70 factor (ECF subfamily)